MKKILVLLLIATFVGAFAFADGITFGAWGRAGYVAYSGSPADKTASFPNWGPGTRVGVNAHGSSANIGFDLNWDINAAGLGVGDQAKVWWKDGMFKLEVGRIQNDTLIGKVGHSWADCVGGNTGYTEFGDENLTFDRFAPNQGLVLSLTPVEGLFIGAGIDSGAASVDKDLAAIQVGAGYTIKDVGQIRAQWKGTNDINSGLQKIEVAFALTAIQGLTLDLGAKIPASIQAQSEVALTAAFSSGPVALGGKVYSKIGSVFGLGVQADFAYTVTGPFAIGLKASFDGTNGLGTAVNKLAFIPNVKLGYSNGYIALGYEIGLNLASKPDAMNWAIPVVVEYWF